MMQYNILNKQNVSITYGQSMNTKSICNSLTQVLHRLFERNLSIGPFFVASPLPFYLLNNNDLDKFVLNRQCRKAHMVKSRKLFNINISRDLIDIAKH